VPGGIKTHRGKKDDFFPIQRKKFRNLNTKGAKETKETISSSNLLFPRFHAGGHKMQPDLQSFGDGGGALSQAPSASVRTSFRDQFMIASEGLKTARDLASLIR